MRECVPFLNKTKFKHIPGLKDLSKNAQKLVTTNIKDIFTLQFDIKCIEPLIKELLSFIDKMKQSNDKYKMSLLNIKNKLIIISFFREVNGNEVDYVFERERFLDMIEITKCNETDHTYILMQDYRDGSQSDVRLEYDTKKNTRISNFFDMVENDIYLSNDTTIYLYLFRNSWNFSKILEFKYNIDALDKLITFLTTDSEVEYLHEYFKLSRLGDCCNICFDDESKNEIITTNCGHAFHLTCFLKNITLSIYQNCAICRTIFFIQRT